MRRSGYPLPQKADPDPTASGPTYLGVLYITGDAGLADRPAGQVAAVRRRRGERSGWRQRCCPIPRIARAARGGPTLCL